MPIAKITRAGTETAIIHSVLRIAGHTRGSSWSMNR